MGFGARSGPVYGTVVDVTVFGGAESTSEALLLRSTALSERDLLVTIFSSVDGKVSAVARSARTSRRRFGGALEPFQLLRVHLGNRDRDLPVLKEATVLRARTGLSADLPLLEAAGRSLRWVRHLLPARTREEGVWKAINQHLDALEAGAPLSEEAARFGVVLLREVGFAMEFETCIVCGRERPPDAPALVDAARGGVVCRKCGGGRHKLSAEALRPLAAFAHGAASPDELVIPKADAEVLVRLTEDAMRAHAAYEERRA